ncbi:hypothetical protein BJX66DRAFT_331184 [Aspergillus keveii]|uniref:Acyltransferase 3 domain-containing protein n=1 Tax=Aspergillus keveii TaxID=714993 RepID=A0ABR4FGQ5_9EURO
MSASGFRWSWGSIAQSSYLFTRIWEALPRSGGYLNMKCDPRKSVKWIHGLRGIASILVVLTHLSLTAFTFLTGCVGALKPMRLFRDGNRLGAFTAVSKSAFRRPPRFIMLATVALVISWIMAQCRTFVTANRSGCWTLLPLLMTSILVHLLTCATMFVESRWRMVVYLFMFLYFHQHAAKNTMQGVYGMFVSDLSYEWPRRVAAVFLAASGLFIAGYPGDYAEWAGCVNGFLSNHPLRWLGAQSFAVYLAHGTLLPIFLCWMLYGITGQPEGKDEPYIDPCCAQMTQKLEDRMFIQAEKPST